MSDKPKKYRPSNGTEGEMFMSLFCYRCKRDQTDIQGKGGCEVLFLTMCFDLNDPDYPNEWTYDSEGEPTCTAFEKKDDGGGR